MSKVVKQHYPVAELPEDLRVLFPSVGYVKVTIEAESPRKSVKQLLNELPSARVKARRDGVTVEDAVARIRALRDEWDD